MKMFAHMIALPLLFSTLAHAAPNFDGCFQLYRPNVMYPAFCLDGTNDEGINGAGVRLVVFGTNTDQVIACGLSSALGGSEKSLEFIQNGIPQLTLTVENSANDRLEGRATLGKTELQYLQIDKTDSARLLAKFYAEKKCANLNIGELRNLKK